MWDSSSSCRPAQQLQVAPASQLLRVGWWPSGHPVLFSLLESHTRVGGHPFNNAFRFLAQMQVELLSFSLRKRLGPARGSEAIRLKRCKLTTVSPAILYFSNSSFRIVCFINPSRPRYPKLVIRPRRIQPAIGPCSVGF